MSIRRPPRISFGIIVLNGEPFTRYCLRSIYPFAYEILVVEGATEKAFEISTPDGHSIDGTLETLKSFQAMEDPEKKIKIITRKGFWNEKDEQSQAYAEKAKGDYLWQVDIDEFYHPEDIASIQNMLTEYPYISGASFFWKNFWGGFDYLADGWAYRDAVKRINGMRRLFRWGKGFQYVSHRPPTVLDNSSTNLCELNWISPEKMASQNIFIYHYGMIFPKQANEKTLYYKKMWKGHEQMELWRRGTFEEIHNPYRIIHALSPPTWLTRFQGKHPPEIVGLKEDLKAGIITIEQRKSTDIERYLGNFHYRITVAALKLFYPVISLIRKVRNIFSRIKQKIIRTIQHSQPLPLEQLPSSPDLFREYRDLAKHPELKRTEGGWYYQGKFYPDYLTTGGAVHAIFRVALKKCKGEGIDIGAGYWPLPGATPVDLNRGEGFGRKIQDFPDCSLDYIFSSHCLEHIAEWRDELNLWIRKLRKDGTIFLYLPHPECDIWLPGSPFVGDGHKWIPTPEIVKHALYDLSCDIIDHDDGPDAMYSFYVCARKK